jgi:hypothetical protein
MARVGKAHGNIVCPDFDIREELAAFGVNPYVVKHSFKGRKSTKFYNLVCFVISISWNRYIPISQVRRVKKMKARILGACATIQIISYDIVSIVLTNGLYTYGKPNWAVNTLITKAKANCLKSIADPKRSVIHPVSNRKVTFGLNYVMPNFLIGVGTRSSVISCRTLKVCFGLKGAEFSVRNFSTGCLDRSLKNVTKKLMLLSQFSKQNDIDGVNSIVKSLIGSPYFWISCYENIKSNIKVLALGENYFIEDKAKTLDGINLEFFYKLASVVSKGKFSFGPIRRVQIQNSGDKIRSIGKTNFRDKIVQKGMTVILEQLCEHRFYEGSFGARKGRSTHDAMFFIRKKVSFGK